MALGEETISKEVPLDSIFSPVRALFDDPEVISVKITGMGRVRKFERIKEDAD